MCLYIRYGRKNEDGTPLPYVSDKPVRCYKVVRKIHTACPAPDNGGRKESVKYVPPIRDSYDFEYRIGETADMKTVPFNDRGVFAEANPLADTEGYEHLVNYGLHSCKVSSHQASFLYDALRYQMDCRKKEAEENPYWPARNGWDEPAVLECEIPAGVPYFEGISELYKDIDSGGYASEKLRVIRELTPQEVSELPHPPARYYKD